MNLGELEIGIFGGFGGGSTWASEEGGQLVYFLWEFIVLIG
jgi:hypothetical protein